MQVEIFSRISMRLLFFGDENGPFLDISKSPSLETRNPQFYFRKQNELKVTENM